jgi:uncharacterized protein YeeX (DUF496 family)
VGKWGMAIIRTSSKRKISIYKKIKISDMKLIKSYNYLMEIESINNSYILYHHTDSTYFTKFDVKSAAKGEGYYNPLGTGLYLTSNPDFGKKFGSNLYYYLLPKSSKILKITASKWSNLFIPIVKKSLKLSKIKYEDLDIGDKVQINRIGKDAPISALNNLQEYIQVSLGKDISENIIKVMDTMNSKYDAIWYTDTDYYSSADEIIIPPNKFKKEFFLKKLPSK